MDKGLLQKDVAILLSVSEDTVTLWENGRIVPQTRHFPAILEFLRYYPFAHETESVAGKLLQWRYCMGLTHPQCGENLKADPRNVRDWEQHIKVPSDKRCKQITNLWLLLPDYLKQPNRLL